MREMYKTAKRRFFDHDTKSFTPLMIKEPTFRGLMHLTNVQMNEIYGEELVTMEDMSASTKLQAKY